MIDYVWNMGVEREIYRDLQKRIRISDYSWYRIHNSSITYKMFIDAYQEKYNKELMFNQQVKSELLKTLPVENVKIGKSYNNVYLAFNDPNLVTRQKKRIHSTIEIDGNDEIDMRDFNFCGSFKDVSPKEFLNAQKGLLYQIKNFVQNNWYYDENRIKLDDELYKTIYYNGGFSTIGMNNWFLDDIANITYSCHKKEYKIYSKGL